MKTAILVLIITNFGFCSNSTTTVHQIKVSSMYACEELTKFMGVLSTKKKQVDFMCVPNRKDQ